MASLLDLAQARLQGLLDIPTRAARAIVNPTAFSGLLGAPTLPQIQGTAEAAYGLPARQNMSVLDPNQAAYLQGYQQGEPLAYLGMATPFAAPAIAAGAKAVAPQASRAVENYMASQGLLQNIVPVETAKAAENIPKAIAIYHGTSPEAAASISKQGFNVKKSADGTIWFTENPEIGEVAATGKGAVVKRILDEDKLKLATPEEADKYFIDQLISQGYDGVKYPGYGAGDFTHYQIFNPKKLNKETKSKQKIVEKVESLLD